MLIKQFPHFISTDDGSISKKIGTIGTFFGGVGAIILDNENKVLLTQRSQQNKKSPGAWEILFGRVDQGEGFEDAITREAMEELSIEIVLERIISTMHFMRLPTEPEHIGIIYLARFIQGQSVTPDPKEIGAWEWVSMEEAIGRVADYTKPHLEWVQKLVFTMCIKP